MPRTQVDFQQDERSANPRGAVAAIAKIKNGRCGRPDTYREQKKMQEFIDAAYELQRVYEEIRLTR